MKLFIFRTDIDTPNCVNKIEHVFNDHDHITKWFIDLEDIDKVLKVKGLKNLTEVEVQHIVNAKGFICEPLPD